MNQAPVQILAQQLLDGFFAGPEHGEAARQMIDQAWRAEEHASRLPAGVHERLEALAAAAESMGVHRRATFPEAEIRLVAHLAREGQSESRSRRLAIS